jgi:hypothetical protein
VIVLDAATKLGGANIVVVGYDVGGMIPSPARETMVLRSQVPS